ncbi:MAG: aldehyde dehydrogenase family protein, partial [Syntrophales bacterium]
MDIKAHVAEIARNAKKAATLLAHVSSDAKDKALLDMAEALTRHTGLLMKENAKDLEKAAQTGLSAAMTDRLVLNESTIEGIAKGLTEVACLPDPVGKVTSMWRRPNGLLVGRMRIPLGVIGIIYESRPNVTADAAALCLKSGNAVILRGGSEAINSNIAIAKILQSVLKNQAIPKEAIQVIPMTEREAVREMLQLEEYIDLII